MLLLLFTVLMYVGPFSTSAASPGSRIRESNRQAGLRPSQAGCGIDAGSSDAAHRFGVQSVSPTSVRHSSGRSAETLPRSLDFSFRSHPVASPDHAGHPSRLSGRSDTARESPVRLSSSAAPSLSGARGMHRHSGTLPGVLSRWRSSQTTPKEVSGAPCFPSRRRTRRRSEAVWTFAPSTGISGTSTSRWRVCTPCETCFAAGTS